MANARVQLSDKTFTDAMQTAKVRAALRAKAAKKQSAAEGIAQSEGVELESRVVEGTRPKGRPYARVQSSNVGQEWGDSKTRRLRILGRASRS